MRLATGLLARSYDQARTGLNEVIDGLVIDFPWRQAQPHGPHLDPYFAGELIAKLDWAHATPGMTGHPLKVRLRPRMGLYTPEWVDAGHRMPWAFDDKTHATVERLPRWWATPYLEAARWLYVQLAALTDGHPALAEVVMSWPTTQYAEPCLKQLHLANNLQVALNSGWTAEADRDAFDQGWSAHADYFQPQDVACYTAFNPPGFVANTKNGAKFRHGSAGRALRLMDRQLELLGHHAVIANNCWTAPVESNTEAYQDLYQRMRDLRNSDEPVPIAFQTETLAKHTDGYPTRYLQRTVAAAAEMGATSVELPVGAARRDPNHPMNHIDLSFAYLANTALRKNADPFIGPADKKPTWPDPRDLAEGHYAPEDW